VSLPATIQCFLFEYITANLIRVVDVCADALAKQQER
jgi:hypothetical protein